MTLLGYSVPETLTNDAGKPQKGKTLAVTGPNAYTGVVVSDPIDGVFRLGPLPAGVYTVTYGDRSVDLPVFPTPTDLQAGYDAAVGAAPSTSLTAETAARAAADSAEASRASAAEAAEIALRATGDSNEASTRAAADAAATAAEAAATALEAADHAAEQTAIGNEATARGAAVTAEQARATAAEAALTANLASETATRTSADAARLLPRGAWVTATAYAVNDEVTANGVAWRCVLAHTAGATFSADPTKWERFGVGQVVSTAPSSPATDDLYYDKAADLWKRWSGTAWVANGSATYPSKVSGQVDVHSRLRMAHGMLLPKRTSTNPDLYRASNAATTVTIPTPDATGEVVEPSVYYNPAGWNGHRYWLTASPFHASNDQLENASIWYSDDGLTWTVPAGVTNPLVPVPGGSGGHNADQSISEGPDGLLYITYLSITNDGKSTAWYISSADGVTWSAPAQIFQVTTAAAAFVCPVMRWDGSLWHLWTMSRQASPSTLTHRTAATIAGLAAASVTTCTITGSPSGLMPFEFNIVESGEEFVAVITLGTDTSGSGVKLFLMTSPDAVTWTCAQQPILRPGVGASSWDRGILYRSTIVRLDRGDGTAFGLWYGGNTVANATGVWGVGYTEVTVAPERDQRLSPQNTGVWYCTPLASAVTLSTQGLGNLFLDLCWSGEGITIDALDTTVTTGVATATTRSGLYIVRDQQRPFFPARFYADLLVEAPSLHDNSSIGQKIVTLTTPVVIPPRTWFATAGAAQTATATLRLGSGLGFSPFGNANSGLSTAAVCGVFQTGVTGALPATIASPSLSNLTSGVGYRRSA